MSNLSMQGGATGTGTVTLLAPVTNTNRTINLPDSNGTIVTSATAGVPIGGPAFSVYSSSIQAVTAGVNAKMLLNQKVFDLNSSFDATTNYRFQPSVAGYYQISAGSTFSLNTATAGIWVQLFKNTISTVGGTAVGTATMYPTAVVSACLFLNGTTDYVELYAYNGSGVSASTPGGLNYVYMSGSMVRSAV